MKPEKSLHDHAITIVNRSFIGIILLIISNIFPILFFPSDCWLRVWYCW